MSADFPKVMHPAPRVQCLHWQQDRSDSPSAGRTRVRAPAPASAAAHH
jgi:hypothetical protein